MNDSSLRLNRERFLVEVCAGRFRQRKYYASVEERFSIKGVRGGTRTRLVDLYLRKAGRRIVAEFVFDVRRIRVGLKQLTDLGPGFDEYWLVSPFFGKKELLMANGLQINIIPLHLVAPPEYMNKIALATSIPQIQKKIRCLDMTYVSIDEYKIRQAKYLKSEYLKEARETPAHRISELQTELRNELSELQEECRKLEESRRKTIRIPRHLRDLWVESEKYGA